MGVGEGNALRSVEMLSHSFLFQLTVVDTHYNRNETKYNLVYFSIGKRITKNAE